MGNLGWTKILAVGLALAAIVGGVILWRGDDHAAEGVTAVTRGELMAKVTVAGSLIPFRRTLFTPPYNGYIKKIFVKLGQEVAEGSPVVSLTQSARGIAEETHPMRAPFNGRVVQVLRQEGEYVEQGKDTSGIVRMDDVSRIFVQSDVPETDIHKIKVGQDVVIKANAILDRSYKGVIREIALAAKDKEKGGWSRAGDRVDFEIRIEVTDKDERVRPGMSAIVDIVTDRRENVLTLPHEFVKREEGKYLVTLFNGEKRAIEVGAQNEELVEITNGLKEGERVKMVDFFQLPKGM